MARVLSAYFTINRARQYGKTPPLALVRKRLKKSHVVDGLPLLQQGRDDLVYPDLVG
jgi:hypothetical protein